MDPRMCHESSAKTSSCEMASCSDRPSFRQPIPSYSSLHRTSGTRHCTIVHHSEASFRQLYCIYLKKKSIYHSDFSTLSIKSHFVLSAPICCLCFHHSPRFGVRPFNMGDFPYHLKRKSSTLPILAPIRPCAGIDTWSGLLLKIDLKLTRTNLSFCRRPR